MSTHVTMAQYLAIRERALGILYSWLTDDITEREDEFRSKSALEIARMNPHGKSRVFRDCTPLPLP